MKPIVIEDKQTGLLIEWIPAPPQPVFNEARSLPKIGFVSPKRKGKSKNIAIVKGDGNTIIQS